MENQFGRTSKLQWSAVKKEQKTILTDVYFTAPYKIMTPFDHKDGSISVMMLSASAGILAGDQTEFDFTIHSQAEVEFLAQSFEKIHKMDQGEAARTTHITVESNGSFLYHPLPVIPYAGSSFGNHTVVELEDDTSRFEYFEILACGRKARQERFSYTKYETCLEVRKSGRLMFRDNSRFHPSRLPMEELGFFEGYSHLGNFLFCNSRTGEWMKQVKELLQQEDEVAGGISELESGDYLVKIFGNQAQKLQEFVEKITLLEVG